MATRKVPSQAASGGETFNDKLIGLQITDGSSQLANTAFLIDRVIPEKDSKNFLTQPFSDFLTLDTLQEETSQIYENNSTSTSFERSKKIKFHNSKSDATKSLFGSLSVRLSVAVSNVIEKYPAAMLVDVDSPVSTTSISAENISYDGIANTTQFKFKKSLIYNPFDIVIQQPESVVILNSKNTYRDFYSSYTKYVIDNLSGSTYEILSYDEPDNNGYINLRVSGKCFANTTGYTENYLIRPNNGVTEEFFNSLDELETSLVDRESYPKYTASFRIPMDLYDGAVSELQTETATWPVSRDGWNLQIIGLDYESYITRLSNIGNIVDDYKSNLIIRFLSSPQLFEFDTEEKKAEAIFQLYGQSFDKVKKFIDNIAYMRNVSYDKTNNVPDVLLKNLSETLGLSTVNLYDEKSLQDTLYTRHTQQYDGVLTGLNLLEGEYEFYRRLIVNLAHLYKTKGTRLAIEFFLKFIGAPEPMIRLDEYIYKVDGLLPKSTYENDIREVILGVKEFHTMEFVPTTTTINGTTYSAYTYRLVTTSGSTTLTRDEYPVYNDGTPRAKNSLDGSHYFAKGAGWYRKTLDHRSIDILDTENSVLTGNTKVLKTKSKPFTYGEDYFNVYRKLPGLDYGYDLNGEINNDKTEIIDDSEVEHILNRKNVNIFLDGSRAIDYDIYTKSRNLSLTFGTLPPQEKPSFAEFLKEAISNVIRNSNTIKYRKEYRLLKKVYEDYANSNGFTPYNYIKINEFIQRMSPYWVNIIDQFVPATTQWLGGNLIENGTFGRSKFQYKQPCTPK